MSMQNVAVHEENADVLVAVRAEAEARGLYVTRYATTTRAGHDGVHRYTVYNGGSDRPYGTRSVRVHWYTEARYSKYYQPSIVGEHRALCALLDWLCGE